MRKLLNTLYIMTESCYLTLDGENIVIQDVEKTLGRFPLHTLENIICFTYKGASPALMGACAERRIGMSFFSPRGAFLARAVGKEYGNVLLRKEQYRISDHEERSIAYARNMIVGKVFNSRWSIERTLREKASKGWPVIVVAPDGTPVMRSAAHALDDFCRRKELHKV